MLTTVNQDPSRSLFPSYIIDLVFWATATPVRAAVNVNAARKSSESCWLLNKSYVYETTPRSSHIMRHKVNSLCLQHRCTYLQNFIWNIMTVPYWGAQSENLRQKSIGNISFHPYSLLWPQKWEKATTKPTLHSPLKLQLELPTNSNMEDVLDRVTYYAQCSISGNTGIALMPREKPIRTSTRTNIHSWLQKRHLNNSWRLFSNTIWLKAVI